MIAAAYIESIVIYSSAARDYILAAVPSGAAQEARYPAGTLGDIQAVTHFKFKFPAAGSSSLARLGVTVGVV